LPWVGGERKCALSKTSFFCVQNFGVN